MADADIAGQIWAAFSTQKDIVAIADIYRDGAHAKSEGKDNAIDIMILRIAPAAPPDDDEVYGSAAPPGWVVTAAITARCEHDFDRRKLSADVRDVAAGLPSRLSPAPGAVRIVETAYSVIEEAGAKRPLVAQTLIDLIYYSASDPLA